MGSNEPMDLVKWQAPNNVKVSLILHDFAFVKAYKTNHVDGDEEPLENVSNEGKPGEPKHISELPPFENKKDNPPVKMIDCCSRNFIRQTFYCLWSKT